MGPIDGKASKMRLYVLKNTASMFSDRLTGFVVVPPGFAALSRAHSAFRRGNVNKPFCVSLPVSLLVGLPVGLPVGLIVSLSVGLPISFPAILRTITSPMRNARLSSCDPIDGS